MVSMLMSLLRDPRKSNVVARATWVGDVKACSRALDKGSAHNRQAVVLRALILCDLVMATSLRCLHRWPRVEHTLVWLNILSRVKGKA